MLYNDGQDGPRPGRDAVLARQPQIFSSWLDLERFYVPFSLTASSRNTA
jgi:hypothetical protein